MKLNIDKHRTERKFAEGDWVYLKLQPYKQRTMKQKHLGKLSPRYYGPFQILQKVGKVSYKLDLPLDSRLHPTFHVSCLKSKLGQYVVSLPSLPSVDSEGIISPEPIAVLQEMTHQLRRRTITQVLVQWQGESKEMLLGKTCFCFNNNFFTLWARCFKGGGVLLGMILQ